MRLCKHATDTAPVCTKCQKNRVKERKRYVREREARIRYARQYYANNTVRIAEVGKRWREANREYLLKYAREWRKANPEYMRKLALRTKYGLTTSAFSKMQLIANNSCQICECPLEEGAHAAYGLAVDHCHLSNRVRGLLCMNCNKGIGCLGDDPNTLRRAVTYLEEA